MRKVENPKMNKKSEDRHDEISGDKIQQQRKMVHCLDGVNMKMYLSSLASIPS